MAYEFLSVCVLLSVAICDLQKRTICTLIRKANHAILIFFLLFFFFTFFWLNFNSKKTTQNLTF